MKTAAVAGFAEIAEAGTALKNSTDARVKSFARKMIADHSKAGRELALLAKQQGSALPNSVGPLDAKSRGTLEGLHGAQFDAAYLLHQRYAHEKTIALFKKEAAAGRDPDIVAYAKKTLPTLSEHLQMDLAYVKTTVTQR